MSRVYWDSMVFIYWLENHPTYAPRAKHIFQSMLARGDRLCASHLSLGEVLAGPLKHDRGQLAAQVEQFFDSGLVELLPFDRSAAGKFAGLRATTKVPPADAIHLACAGAAGVDLFLTPDRRLHKMQVPGIQFIAGLDVNVF
ncbi:MAG: type II toxin-antitoxin system VapC family toxin [Terracidiphilus sp.]